MHELSIALSLIDMASEEAERHGGGRVLAVRLKLGALSGVVGTALQSAYELAREGSPLADAELLIEEVAVLAHCPACNGPRSVVSVQHLCCAECGTVTPKILCGRELEIVALEVES